MTTRLQPAELPRWSRWLGGTPPPSPNTLHGTTALPRETHIPATADRYNSGRSKAATAGPEPSFLPGLGREPAPIAARTPSCGGGVNDAPGASREPRAGVSLASFLTSFNVDFDVSFPSKWGFAQDESQNAHAQLGYQLSPPIWGLSHQPRLPKLVPLQHFCECQPPGRSSDRCFARCGVADQIQTDSVLFFPSFLTGRLLFYLQLPLPPSPSKQISRS